MSQNADADLLTALESEYMGEAVFRTLYYTSLRADRRDKARALWRLETQTKERLIVYCKANGYTLPSGLGWSIKGVILGTVLLLLPWQAFIRATLRETDKFIEVFRRLESRADEQGRPLFSHVVAHELAIQRFAQLEKDGADDSIAPVTALLRA